MENNIELRDYFAAMAMQGILARGPENFTSADGINMGEELGLIAPAAYEIAETMLAARQVKP